MKTTVSFNDFVDAFQRYARYDSFGYEGLRIIFDYLEEYEESTGEEIEMDVIAICCDYTLEHYSDIAKNYGIELNPEDEEREHIEAVREYLEENTAVLGETGDGCNFVYQVF
jgi:hypothetical protein